MPQSSATRWRQCVVTLGLVMGLNWGAPSWAASLERTLAVLEKERTAYATEVQSVREAIESRFDDVERRYRKAGTPEAIDQIERIAGQRRLLVERNELPESAPERLVRKIAVAHERLRRAYRDAVAACLAESQDDRARQLRDELAALERSPHGVMESMQRCPPPESTGDWRVVGDELRTESTSGTGKFIDFGDPSWTDYDLEAEVLVERQGELSLTFRVRDGNYWKLDFCAFQAKDNLDLLAAVKGEYRWKHASRRWMPGAIALEFGRWYSVRVQARGETVEVFLDGKLRATSQHPELISGRIGAYTHGSAQGRFRGFRVTAPDGKLLWHGVPRSPARS